MVHIGFMNSYKIWKIAFVLSEFISIGSYAKLDSIAEWKYVEYDFDSAEQEALAIESGSYNYLNNILVDVDSSPEGKVFLTLIRNDGVPASLTTMQTGRGKGGGPLLRPYPDWSWADVNNCSNIIGSYRIATDECNRLWVLDSGKMDNQLICQPKLLSFDMGTDELLEIVELPDDVVYGKNGETLLLYIIVDTVGANCSETDETFIIVIFLYSVSGYGLGIFYILIK